MVTKLFRPVGLSELALIWNSGMCEFPPRLPHQPIFYPVTNIGYARQIARHWNTVDERSGFCGFVTAFEVDRGYLSNFEKHIVGSSNHEEYWIPSSELSAFNQAIKGLIQVEEAYFGSGFKGLSPASVSLKGRDAAAQFITFLIRIDLLQLAELHRKYRNYGQASVLHDILTTLDMPNPDFKRLAGIEMWGGAGAIWEGPFGQSEASGNDQADKTLFRQIIVRMASSMDSLGCGTDRSRFIASVLQSWLDKGI